MKRILVLLLLGVSISSFGQSGWIKPNNSAGTIVNGISADSAMYGPTGCGAPTLYSKVLKKSTQYYDSCNKRFYLYDPKLAAWDTVRVGAAAFSGVDVLDSISAIDAYSNSQAKTFIVKDSLRGGLFLKYDGIYAADGGMIFEDGLAQKWIRQTSDNKINVQWYGARASASATDNRNRIIAARDYIYNNFSKGILYIPKDTTGGSGYYLSDSISFNKPIIIEGDGELGFPKSKLIFPLDKNGIVIDYAYPQEGFSGGIKNIHLSTPLGGTGPYNVNAHAIKTPLFIDIYNVWAYGWGGDGLHISACGNIPTGENNNYGNASNSVINYFKANYCTNGIFIEGCDANTIEIRNADCSQNRRWGSYDNNMLGNLYLKPHFAFNGPAAINGAMTVVEYGGKYYAAKPGYDGYWSDASDSNYNKPPVDSTLYWDEVPFMTSTVWNDSTRYYSGGALCIRNQNSYSNVLNPYTEAFQPPIWLNPRSKSDGGDNGAGVRNGSFDQVVEGERKIMNSNLVLPNINETVLDTTQKHITIGKQSTDYGGVLAVYNDYTLSGILSTTKFETTGAGLYSKFKNGFTEGHIVYNVDSWIFQTNGLNNRLFIDATGTYPDSDSSRDLGTSSAYWKRAYSKRYYGDLRTATNFPQTLNMNQNINANSNEIFFDNVSQFGVISGFIDLSTAGQLNELHITDDSLLFKKRASYASNVHSSFTQHSLVDKDYLDSMLTTVGGGSPGGNTTNIQYNNAGAFAGSDNNTWTAATNMQTIDSGIIKFTGSATFGDAGTGSIFKSSTYGLAMRAVSGSFSDWLLFGTSGNSILANHAGTDDFATSGKFGAGLIGSSITAWMDIAASTTTKSSLRLRDGVAPTSPNAGDIWKVTDKFYGVINTGTATKEFTLNDAALTSGRIPYTTTNGRITDNSALTWNGSKVGVTGDVETSGKVLSRNVIHTTSNKSDADFTADPGNAYVVPNVSTARTITLPASPADGDMIKIYIPVSLTDDWQFSGGTVISQSGATETKLSSLSTWVFQYDAANSVWRVVINI